MELSVLLATLAPLEYLEPPVVLARPVRQVFPDQWDFPVRLVARVVLVRLERLAGLVVWDTLARRACPEVPEQPV